MQGYTHVIAGSLIQGGARKAKRPPGVVLAIIAVVGVASHIVLDALSLLTYHPAHAPPGDPFWIGYHVIAYALTVYLAVKLRRFWVGIGFALLPDLDWVQREAGKLLGTGPAWRPGAVHDFFASLPGLSHFVALCDARLPNWHEQWWACAGELAVGFYAAYLVSRWRPPERLPSG